MDKGFSYERKSGSLTNSVGNKGGGECSERPTHSPPHKLSKSPKILERAIMKYRTLGKTRLEVSEVSVGMWAIGGDAWGPVEDTNSLSAIRKAWELGVNFFDTADVYGRGHS